MRDVEKGRNVVRNEKSFSSLRIFDTGNKPSVNTLPSKRIPTMSKEKSKSKNKQHQSGLKKQRN